MVEATSDEGGGDGRGGVGSGGGGSEGEARVARAAQQAEATTVVPVRSGGEGGVTVVV